MTNNQKKKPEHVMNVDRRSGNNGDHSPDNARHSVNYSHNEDT